MSDPGAANIVPFGKYKGRAIEELLIDDPAYLQWLAGQDWFRTRFTVLHQVIINRGAEPEETPEHNALQVKFLDDEFCLRFTSCLRPKLESDVRSQLNRQRDYNLATIAERIEWLSNPHAYGRNEKLPLLHSAQQTLSASIDQLTFKFVRKFEEQGVDVVLTIYIDADYLNEIEIEKLGIGYDRWRWLEWRTTFNIEIKPVIGDDYPAVLRQMKANESNVLFIGDYRGQGATREQFIKTFATAHMHVVFADELERA
jgi:uncharacterized protein (DUF3820 family)